MKQPKLKTNLEGGIWRIRRHPFRPDILGLACMHNGFMIIDAKTHKKLTHYTEHDSLAYGLDFQWNEELTLASCSFYDHLLTVWSVEEEN